MRDHRKLRAFELVDQLVIDVYRGTRDFPKAEQFGLTSQVRRAIVSAASNIVEGCARDSRSDYAHYLQMAYGSLMEAEYQMGLSCRLGFLAEEHWKSLAESFSEAGKVLNGLIRSVRKP